MTPEQELFYDQASRVALHVTGLISTLGGGPYFAAIAASQIISRALEHLAVDSENADVVRGIIDELAKGLVDFSARLDALERSSERNSERNSEHSASLQETP